MSRVSQDTTKAMPRTKSILKMNLHFTYKCRNTLVIYFVSHCPNYLEIEYARQR